MTGSLFNNYLVTNLEMSQSIANGTFTVKNTGIPQDNIAITAYSASYYTQLSGLGLSNQMYPSWGQLYAARPSITSVLISPTYEQTGYNTFNVVFTATTSEGSLINVDTNVTVLGAYSYSVGHVYYHNTFSITISSGTNSNYFTITPCNTILNININSLYPTASPNQRYLIGSFD